MDQLTPEQVERIYVATDDLLLDRDRVVVPLAAKEGGLELVMGDGKLLVRAPAGAAFETWFSGLRSRLDGMDLASISRAVRKTLEPS